MTQIDLTTFVTTIGEPGQTPHSAWVIFTPWRGSEPVERVEGAELTIPDGVRHELVDGVPIEPIIVPPDDGTFAWRATVASDDPEFKVTRYVSVPSLPVVAWADLIDVDPYSLLANRVSVKAWESAVRSPSRSILTVEARTQSEMDALLAADAVPDTQVTYIIPG